MKHKPMTGVTRTETVPAVTIPLPHGYRAPAESKLKTVDFSMASRINRMFSTAWLSIRMGPLSPERIGVGSDTYSYLNRDGNYSSSSLFSKVIS